MLLKNSHLWVDASLRARYGYTALMLLVAFLVRYGLDQWLNPYMPTQFFLLSALLTALWFGYVPALISLVVGWLIGLYYFVEPYGQFSPANTYDLIVTFNDLASGVVGISVIEYLQRTRYSMRLMLTVSDSRYRSLLRLDNHRVHQQRLSNRSLRQMSEILSHLDRVLVLVDQDRHAIIQPLLIELAGLQLDNMARPSRNWLELVHAEERNKIEQDMATVMDGLRDSHDMQLRISAQDGEVVTLNCVFRALPLMTRRSVFAMMLKAGPDQSRHP